MRIVVEGTISAWAAVHARAVASLQQWVKVARAARWHSFADLCRVFPSADWVTVRSGRKVVLFNIGGNDFRLICAGHFNSGMVFALRFLTHAEYSKGRWRIEL